MEKHQELETCAKIIDVESSKTTIVILNKQRLKKNHGSICAKR
jgi:hypothetical protein